jgi:predicted Abi (CAAX) family protease
MIICIASDPTVCPETADWSFTTIVIVLILAIAAFKAFKLWVKRKYPLDRDFDD